MKIISEPKQSHTRMCDMSVGDIAEITEPGNPRKGEILIYIGYAKSAHVWFNMTLNLSVIFPLAGDAIAKVRILPPGTKLEV